MDPLLYRIFPTEICNIILEYQGYHKNRNGKYMKQLYIKDPKYKIFDFMPENIKISKGWGTECCFIKKIDSKIYRNVINITVYENYVEWIMASYFIIPVKKYGYHYQEYENNMIRFITHS
jgi:hypothetical protein